MVTRSKARLTGQRNQCPACGELFTRNSVFAKHRVGKFGISRRCMTVDEMNAAGMFKGEDQFWRGAKYGGPYCPRPGPPEDIGWHDLEGIHFAGQQP